MIKVKDYCGSIVMTSLSPSLQGVFPLFCRCEEPVRLPSPVIARSAGRFPSPRHCEECRKARRSNLIAWFPHTQLFPMFVIARKDGVLPKQSLFSRTFGIPAQLQPRTQRLPRGTTVPLAVTDWGPEIASGTCRPAITDRKKKYCYIISSRNGDD